MVENWTDESIYWDLKRGGHDYRKVYAAYKAAMEHTGQPTVILAKTIKGYGLGSHFAGRNATHQMKKMTLDDLKGFRDSLRIPISDEQLEADPVVVEQPPRDVAVVQRPELQEHGEEVGQLRGVELDPCCAVGLLEAHQCDTALAGVPVGEVRQVQGAAAGHVEGVDVVHLQLPGRGALQHVHEGREVGHVVLRHLGEGRPQQRDPGHELLGGVVQQQRDHLPHARTVRRVERGPAASITSPLHQSPSLGNIPLGTPLPSQFSRLTLPWVDPPERSSPDVWRSLSISKFSAATPLSTPEPSPKISP